jgi:hypothetical protein
LVLLTGCSGAYERLHGRFAAADAEKGRELNVERVALIERGRRGVTDIGDSIDFILGEDSLIFKDNFRFLPGRGNVRIPASEVSACSMVCFGAADRHIDFIINSVNIDITVSDRDQLREWCWNNRIPAISGRDRRRWLHDASSLPVLSPKRMARPDFDKKMQAACAGY